MKLTRKQIDKKEELFQALTQRFRHVVNAVSRANEEIESAIKRLNEEVRQYQLHMTEAHDFVKLIMADVEDEIEDKTERWHESERGEAMTSFRDDWDGAESKLDEKIGRASMPKLLISDLFDGELPHDVLNSLPEEPNV